MLTASDLVHIEFTKQMTQAGIAYAIHTLITRRDFKASRNYDRLRSDIVDIAVELAFRRHLSSQGIPHDSHVDRPFTRPELQSLFIGGRKCEIINFFISKRDIIYDINRDNNQLLQAPVKIPAALLEMENFSDNDLLIFAFTTGLVTATQDELDRAQRASQPTYFIHLPPRIWSHPSRWRSLGQMVITNTGNVPLSLEVTGSDKSKVILKEQIHLAPLRKVASQAEFYSLNLLSITQEPGARITVYSPQIKKIYHIDGPKWVNIWVYGMEIILAGFITFGEIKRSARPLKSSAQTIRLANTTSTEVALPLIRLHPLADLFHSALNWTAND